MTKHYDFIEIGTSDFDTLIETSDDKTVGLSIEPIRYYLDRLPNKENVKKIEAAISDNDGFIEIYYIPDEKIQEHNLKWWVRGSNSIGKPHPFALQELGEEFYNSIVKIEKVPTLSWKTLVEKEEIGSIDYLKIDTEGFDHVILNDYLKMCEENPNLLARKIKFERHSNVSNISEIDNIISKFKGYKVEYSESDVVLQKLRIPKIIHQTFRTKELPEELRVSVESLKKLNPDFEYRYYDDEDCYNFIKENYDEETLSLYSSINPKYGSSKSDFFRYLLMYKVGGVYLDIKSSAKIPLNDIILPTDEYLLTHWEGRDWNQILNYYHGEFQNWHIICKPNHPFLEKTIELVKRNIRNYKGEKGKISVLNLTGPIVYSEAIVSLIDEYRTYTFNSPVREFKVEDEIHLTYKNILPHHSSVYGTNVAQDEPIIIKEINTTDKSYLLYSTESYFDIVNACVKSIREFSELPIIVYLINSDKQIEVSNTKTIRWDLEMDDSSENLHLKDNNNFYIDREKTSIYNILIQRPLIVKDALEKYSNVIAYVDSDSVATQYCDRIFDMYDSNLDYPYFVEGIYDYLHINGRGGAESRDDLSTTLEHPACELFGVNQYVRQRYRQTGYFVAGQNTIDFMDEWYQMCIHPKILENFQHYAPYHEETIANVLLWKYNRLDGLPYIYMNGDNQTLDRIFNNNEFTGESRHLGHWLRIPATEQDLLFVHGEKRQWVITEMLERLKIRASNAKKNCGDILKKLKVLFLAPHLSTGGMPGFLLKRLEVIKKYHSDVELYVVEYSNYSPMYVVQKNKIKELLTPQNFFELGNDKMKLIDIIKENNIDIVHVDEMIEGFDSYNKVPNQLMNALYDNNRTWRMVETCHNVSFNPSHSKKFHPDAYAFCTPYHKEVTFKYVPSYGEVIEFPIDKRFRTKKEQESAQKELGLSLDRTHIINVGLWTSGKNQVEGVEIAKLLEKSHPGLQFHFIGNQAPNFKEYWEPVMDNLPSNVKVWGERSDVSTFMKAADVFMFNSTWECNPLVLREAASYGLKILARNLPQYLGMFDTFVTPLTDNLEQNVNILRELINSDKSYNIELGASKKFALEHYNLYKLTMNKEPMENIKSISDINIIQYYINQPFLEITGDSDSTFKVKFFDEQGVCHYENDLKSNHWVKLNREYFTKWNTKVWEDGTLIYDNTLDYKGKRVFINFDSKSLGDSLSWIPYALEFQNVHQCKVIVCTYWNNLFSKVYPELEFVVPGNTVNNIHGQYSIGWFYDQNKEPQLPNTIPLQKCVTNILGLPFEEIKPRISYQIGKRPYKQKYVTIATNSTSGCKFWTREGWQELINHLHSLGYKIINVSLENNPFKNCEKIKNTDINYTMNVIHHSEFFIGLSSGLSWLAWSLDKHVVMISNFTEPDHEFTSNCTRITNLSVCNGCWNNPNYKFDKGDWNWCPIHKGTERQFECHTSITSDMVINQIQHLLK
jgi:autotransporter strand-loop-strand O-heptosyltransferase